MRPDVFLCYLIPTMANDNRQNPHDIDPRIPLASERTLLAWIRTSVALMGFGFLVARFGLFLRELAIVGLKSPPTSTGISMWIGTAMVLLGVAITLFASREHILFLKRLESGEPYRPSRWSLALTVAMILATLGFGMALYLLTITI